MNYLRESLHLWTGVALPAVTAVAVKSVFVLAAAGFAVLVWRRASAANRHLVWLLAIAGLLLLPLLSGVLPGWNLLPRGLAVTTLENATGGPAAGWLRVEAPVPEPLAEGSPSVSSVNVVSAPDENGALAARASHDPPADNSAPTGKGASPFDWWTFALLLWLAGVAVALAPTVVGLVSLWVLGRRSRVLTGPAWTKLLAESSGSLELDRPVRLISSDRRRMPMTWGVFRSWLLLPAAAEEWPAERRRLVLLHELAHVKRWDHLTNLLTRIVCALYWFNPLVWLAARRMAFERERACDDLVLSRGTRPADYADQILQLAAAAKAEAFPVYGAVAAARPSDLEGRLLAILDGQRSRAAVSGIALLAALGGVSLVVAPLAMLRAAAEPAEADSAAGTAVVPAPADLPYVFDRTYEREMRAGDARYLDLDTGQFTASRPPGDLCRLEEKADARARAGFDLAVVAVPASRWEAKPDEVVRELRNARPVEQVRLGGDEPQPTWLFRTREGGLGVLQLLAHPQRADSVLVRHKLVRPRREFAVHTAVLTPSGGSRVLSLDDAQTYANAPTNAAVAYLEQNPDRGWQVVVENAHNYHTKPERGRRLWEEMSAEEISEPAGLAGLPLERTGFYELKPLPQTILIPQYGLLQIAGVDERTGPSVILHYKQVRYDVQKPANPPAGTASPARRAAAPAERAEPERADGDEIARVRLKQAEVQLARLQQLHAQKLVSDEALAAAQSEVQVRRAERQGDAAEAARARLRQAEAELARMQKLRAEKLVSEAEFQRAQAEVQVRQAELQGNAAEVARVRLRQAEAEFERMSRLHAEKLVGEAELDQARANLEMREAELRNRTQNSESSALREDPRRVVNEWLAHVGAGRTEAMWTLTTRENGMDTNIRRYWEFKSVRARRLLRNGDHAMVVSSPFQDNSGRERVLQFFLVKRATGWLIREMAEDSPENVQRRAEGFMAHPGVAYDVRPEDIVGEWRSGFLVVAARHSFHADGSGEARDEGGDGAGRPRTFRWDLKRDVLRRDFGAKGVSEGKIVRLEDDLFAVRYPDGSQVGYRRVKGDTLKPSHE